MLTEDEWYELNRLGYRAIIAVTAVMGLFAVPDAVAKIREATEESFKTLFGFGSKLSDKYDKAMALEFSPVFYEKGIDEERELWKVEVAALIAAGLLGSAYELLKDHRDPYDPLWEFVRHARNACFHGNKFTFKKYNDREEPTRPAEWRGKAITKDLEGTPLFFDFIHFADVFYLLSDLTQKIGLPFGKPPILAIDPDWEF